MIPVRKIEYVLDESCDQVLSRLKWAVDDYELFWILLKNNFTDAESDTSKEWIGSLSEDEKRFKLIGSLGLVQIIVKGKIETVGRGTVIKTQIKLGLYTSILLIALMTFFALLFLSLSEGGGDSKMTAFVLPLGFLIFKVYQAYQTLNLIESRLDDLFQDLPSN